MNALGGTRGKLRVHTKKIQIFAKERGVSMTRKESRSFERCNRAIIRQRAGYSMRGCGENQRDAQGIKLST